ncbi:MAG: hypothetical protein H6581_12405 [Bacteroidia bacterium]|nr:hypothetical protein [Bacteroidia bacterium]
MLSELTPHLRQRLDQLILQDMPDPDAGEEPGSFASLFPEYVALAKEMIEGLEVWMMRIFAAKSTVRQYANNLDQECKDIQTSLIRCLDHCHSEENDTLLKLEYELRNALHYFVQYQTIIKQNISLVLHRHPGLMHSAHLRAANWHITKSRTDFLKLLEKGDQLSMRLAGNQTEAMLENVLDADKRGQFLEILYANQNEEGDNLKSLFTPEEQEILGTWLDEK